MGENTGIGWTDNTQNFWWGCTEAGPGCDGCYAREWAERLGKHLWGIGVPRLLMGKHTWDQPDVWERKAIREGKLFKVFAQSMSDFFDKEVNPEWRTKAWERIKRTKHLRWQILTKRSSLIDKMLPDDWGDEYAHVGFMCTVVNQMEADRDVPRLLALKKKRNVTWVGLSVEPMLGAMTLAPYLPGNAGTYLDWVIIGGESAKGEKALAKCRTYNMDDALTLLQQVRAAGVPAFHKQLGTKPVFNGGLPFTVQHWKGEVAAEWPDAFKHQEFPQALLH